MENSVGTWLDWLREFCCCWWFTRCIERTRRSWFGSSRRERPQRRKGDSMKTDRSKKPKMVIYRREPGSPLTAKQRANLEELLSRADRKIDTSDIPELPAGAWQD